MGRLRWYKRDPTAALDGMMILTLEERGAYNTVLDLIYARDGAVPDDARFLAGCMGCDVRIWKRIRGRLIGLCKLYVDGDSLRNSRADAEVLRGLHMVLSAAEAGRASARKRDGQFNQTNDIAQTPVERPFQLTTSTIRKKEPPIVPQGGRKSRPVLNGHDQDFEAFWQAVPRKTGRGQAERAYLKALKLATPTVLLGGIERYARERSAADPQFTKHPATWLNGKCWLDEPDGEPTIDVAAIIAEERQRHDRH